MHFLQRIHLLNFKLMQIERLLITSQLIKDIAKKSLAFHFLDYSKWIFRLRKVDFLDSALIGLNLTIRKLRKLNINSYYYKLKQKIPLVIQRVFIKIICFLKRK